MEWNLRRLLTGLETEFLLPHVKQLTFYQVVRGIMQYERGLQIEQDRCPGSKFKRPPAHQGRRSCRRYSSTNAKGDISSTLQ